MCTGCKLDSLLGSKTDIPLLVYMHPGALSVLRQLARHNAHEADASILYIDDG